MKVFLKGKRGKIRSVFFRIYVVSLVIVIAIALSYTVINLFVVGVTEGDICSADKYVSFCALEHTSNSQILGHKNFSPDAIIVLGCEVYPDKTPSPMLAERLDTAIAIYKSGDCKKLLMSGDHEGQYYDEVDCMREYALAQGVPSEDIFMDHAGLSTYETVYRAKAIFNIDSAIFVTQDYHLHRTLYIADELGIDAIGVRAEGGNYRWRISFTFRETLARVKDAMYCIVKPKPTFLGEEIDIHGNGEVTLGG